MLWLRWLVLRTTIYGFLLSKLIVDLLINHFLMVKFRALDYEKEMTAKTKRVRQRPTRVKAFCVVAARLAGGRGSEMRRPR